MANPKVSIIVPCFNYGSFLAEALESILAQEYANWDCIVVDDGSTDDTEDVAISFCGKDHRINYLYKDNGGHSSARNLGIRRSDGEYILLLDADDKIDHKYIGAAMEAFRNPDVKIVTGQVQLFGDKTELIIMPEYNFRNLLIINFLTVSCIFRRSDYERTEGFDETMQGFEDWDFFIQLLKHGGQVIELPFVCLYYRKKEHSVFSDFLKNKEQQFKDYYRIYSKHIDSYSKHFDSPIQLIQENEKLNRVIAAYQKTRTYKLGLRLQQLKRIWKR